MDDSECYAFHFDLLSEKPRRLDADNGYRPVLDEVCSVHKNATWLRVASPGLLSIKDKQEMGE